MQPEDTVTTTETVTDKALGTDQTQTVSDTTDKTPAPDVAAQLDAERKERQKAEMERNMLRKKIEEAETNSLKEKEDYKTLAEQLQAKLEAREAAEAEQAAEKEATDFRNEFISKQPEQLQKVLKNLIAANPTNFLWSNANDWDDARGQLEKQATAIADALGLQLGEATDDKPVDEPVISANNPIVKIGGVDPNDLSIEELRKLLPKAPSR